MAMDPPPAPGARTSVPTERLVGHDGVERAATALLRGELVAVPTETVYGLAARAFDPEAVQAIFAAKGRPADNPLIVHVDGGVEGVVEAWSTTAQALAKAFWPGPLTLVCPRHPSVPDVVSAGRPTVAVRCPDHPIMRALIRRVGPLAAPSANRSGRPSPTTAEHVLHDLDGRIAGVLDGGPCAEGLESTVVDVTSTPPMVLRPGTITIAQLRDVIGSIDVHPSVLAPVDDVDARAPGMRYRHYSPDAEVVLLEGPESGELARRAAERAGTHAVVVGGGASVRTTVFPDGGALRRALYAELRRLDQLGIARIVFGGIPGEELALLNRIRKAAG